LVIFPITVVLVVVRLIHDQALVMRWRGAVRVLSGRWRQAGVFAALALGHVLAGWVAIWAHYEFRYAASPNPADPSLQFFQPVSRDAIPLPLAKTLAWIKKTHFLPEGFSTGIESLLACDDALGSFMHGEWSLRGRWTFFPYAIWVKTPPVVFVLLGLGAIGMWRTRRRAVSGGFQLYAVSPHLALLGSYLALALTEDINIGHRHVLPIYPSLYVLAGAATLLWMQGAWPKLFLVGSIVALAVDSVVVRPHYLAYFGPQAGGPENGYKHLVDSSLDWGMDLPALRQWIDEHNPNEKEQMFLAYFGTDRPSHYGIRARRLPGFLARREFAPSTLGPGYYAISATLYEAVYTAAFGQWNQTYEDLYRAALAKILTFERTADDPVRRAELLRQIPVTEWMNIYDMFEDLRLARLCAWLRHQGSPPEKVGHSIFIWKLDYPALAAALVGPPVELSDGPALLRHFRQFGPSADRVNGSRLGGAVPETL
jgi:hypothetical protein